MKTSKYYLIDRTATHTGSYIDGDGKNVYLRENADSYDRREDAEARMKQLDPEGDWAMIVEEECDYMVEIAEWADQGDTHYYPATDMNDAKNILANKSREMRAWANAELGSADGIPAIANIRIRPEADEDGDYPEIHEWEIV